MKESSIFLIFQCLLQSLSGQALETKDDWQNLLVVNTTDNANFLNTPFA